MRKFFALALAVAMVLSLASVSFAANPTTIVDLEGPFRYDADKDAMIDVNELNNANKITDTIRYGGAAYYAIKINDGATSDYQETYKKIEKLKVKAEFEMGEDLVKSVSIVKKYVDDQHPDNDLAVNNAGYYYFVELKIVSKETTSEADVVAKLEFNRKADSDLNTKQIKDEKEEVEFSVFYDKAWIFNGASYTIDGNGDGKLKYDTNYALKFDSDEEVELEFGDANTTNEGTFTVDVSGQGKVFLKYNTKANEAIVAANPGVDMFFLNFNNVKFNRVGEFVYEMEDIAAAYKVVGDKLVEIKGLEIDGEEAIFNTRVLESYVFATAELVNPAAAVEAPVVAAPAVTNPSTGA